MEPYFQVILSKLLAIFDFVFETLNGRLPLKHSSDRPQTLPKRVSDDPRRLIFRRPKIFFWEICGSNF